MSGCGEQAVAGLNRSQLSGRGRLGTHPGLPLAYPTDVSDYSRRGSSQVCTFPSRCRTSLLGSALSESVLADGPSRFDSGWRAAGFRHPLAAKPRASDQWSSFRSRRRDHHTNRGRESLGRPSAPQCRCLVTSRLATRWPSAGDRKIRLCILSMSDSAIPPRRHVGFAGGCEQEPGWAAHAITALVSAPGCHAQAPTRRAHSPTARLSRPGQPR